jgi:outer membrane protein OmpA-like peptidoglycan-associated protein
LAPYRFRIIGHTDAVGSEEYNQRLSEQRANRVRETLIEEFGIAPRRLVAEGAGESDLIGGLPNDAPEHRRVEIVAMTESVADPAATESDEDDTIDW